MATLTSEQVQLLAWMVESGPGRYLLVRTHAEPDTLVGPQSQNRDLDGSDVRELVALGLLRAVRENSYEVTNAGQAVYDHIKNPPPDRPPVGFHPRV